MRPGANRWRAILVLLLPPLEREDLDAIAGCSNGPTLVAEPREKVRMLHCNRIQFADRDGRHCRTGVGLLTLAERLQLPQWMPLRVRLGGRRG